MKLYICSAYEYDEYHNFAYVWLTNMASKDPYKVHEVEKDPEKADIILFAEHHPPQDPYFFEVLKHPLVKDYSEKCVLYHDYYSPLPLMPTISPSVEKNVYSKKVLLPGPYIARHTKNESIVYMEERPFPKYLFSFIGAGRTHPVRKEILKISSNSAFLKDTSAMNHWALDKNERKAFEKDFIEISLSSKFVLCPRGLGPNSYRLYEMMEMGIPPVIISDDWVAMDGPNWSEFSIWVKEKDVIKIPEILKEKEGDYLEMGLKARKAWEEWFSDEVCFHHIAVLCAQFKDNRIKSKSIQSSLLYLQFIKPFHFRNLIRFYKRKFQTSN